MRRGVLVLAAVGSLLLGGCTDDPEPRIGTAPSSTGAVPTPTEAETTAVAESPETVIRRWIDLETQMQNVNDAGPYLALTDNCKPCDDLAAKVARYYADGGFVRLADQRVTEVRPFASNNAEARFDVFLAIGPTEYRTSAKSETQRFPGGPVHYRVAVARGAEGWTVRNYFRIADS